MPSRRQPMAASGKDTIDFIKNRQDIAEGMLVDEKMFEDVLGKPQQK